MEELLPLLIFIGIAAVNLFKFLAERKGRAGGRPAAPEEAPGEEDAPARRSPLEEFFGELARKIEPQPVQLPDWPEGYERPDYPGEMEVFARARNAAPPEPEEGAPPPRRSPAAPKKRPARPAAPAPKGEPVPASPPATLFPSAHGLRMPGINSVVRSGQARRINLDLRDRSRLRQAVIAQIVFSPPRALAGSFDNTIAK